MADFITKKETDYSQWYLDIVLKAELADYSPIKGSMVIRPRGYAIWESMQSHLDTLFKDTGHQNAYFPLLIPEAFIAKEAEHVEGFSPELAVVTHAGGAPLETPYVIRPTSETIIWSMYKKWIQSYRDLPLLINQWANVVRWEKRTRLFLRTSEFLWQEGHTAHESKQEAVEETLRILDIYRRFLEDYLAIPVQQGRKTKLEKFAGAVDTYCVEALMQDGKALQMGTSHFLGQNFAKAFDVRFQTRQKELEYVWATSWGVSTRMIGGLIMTHSDNKGLVVPPRVAPTQVVIVPIVNSENKREVLTEAHKLYDQLSPHYRTVLDDDDTSSPGFKFSEWELRGSCLRIELGPRDIAKASAMLVRRDSGVKTSVPLIHLSKEIQTHLDSMHHDMYHKAKTFVDQHTHRAHSYDEFKQLCAQPISGYIIADWDGSDTVETQIKEDTMATVRVVNSIDPHDTKKPARCIVSGRPATARGIFAKSY